MIKYLIDSNIIIYHLNGEMTATDFIENHIKVSAISRISYIEIMAFEFPKEIEAEVVKLLRCFEIIDTSSDIAIQAVKNRRKKSIKVPDNIIASTAQVNDLILVTRNTSDFNTLKIKVLDIFDHD